LLLLSLLLPTHAARAFNNRVAAIPTREFFGAGNTPSCPYSAPRLLLLLGGAFECGQGCDRISQPILSLNAIGNPGGSPIAFLGANKGVF